MTEPILAKLQEINRDLDQLIFIGFKYLELSDSDEDLDIIAKNLIDITEKTLLQLKSINNHKLRKGFKQ